jgi:hypothetical protein
MQDFAAPMTLQLAVQPIQILVGIALLIYTLGYSALVGLAVSGDTAFGVSSLIHDIGLDGCYSTSR